MSGWQFMRKSKIIGGKQKFSIFLSSLIIFVMLSSGCIFEGDTSDKWEEANGGNDNGDVADDFTVNVPEPRLFEAAQYDYTVYAELYSENKTSGEWEKYTLNIDGQIVYMTPDIQMATDGFGDLHSTVCHQQDTVATISVLLENSEGEPVSVSGTLTAERAEYTDLNSRTQIQTVSNGHVGIDKLPKATTPIPITYDGYLHSYLNPNEPALPGLEDHIFLNNQTLKIGDNGSVRLSEEEWVEDIYNWSVERAEKVSGYDTLLINITSKFWDGWLPYNEKVWISNEVPMPVKIYIRSNISFEDENGSFYTILETTRTLQEDGFSCENAEPIPWGMCEAEHHFRTKKPGVEYANWEYLPVSGNKYEDSSFDLEPEEAVKVALEQSEGLKEFIERYSEDRVVVDYAEYRAEKDKKDLQEKAGTYTWNLTFEYHPTIDDRMAARKEYEETGEYPNWGYRLKVARNITKELGLDRYSTTTEVMADYGERRGGAPYDRSDLNEKLLTLSASEFLLKSNEIVEEEIFNKRTDKIDWDDTYYRLVMGGETASLSALPGAVILENILGISMAPPSSRVTWMFQKGTVYEGGGTFTAAVDAESGQLLYIMEIEGTAIFGLFGGM